MAFIGSVTIENVSGGNVQFGNIVNMSPISSSRTTTGSGSENEGMLVMTNSGYSLSLSKLKTSGLTASAQATTPIASPTAPSLTSPAALNPAVPIGVTRLG